MWEVEFTDEFERWWDTLTADEQESLTVSVELLQVLGPALRRPHADTIRGSRHKNMKELRTQYQGRPLRTLFAFDSRWHAILLIGGEKTGEKRWYDQMVPIADRLLDEYLQELKDSGEL